MKKWLLLLNSLILSFSVHAADTWKEIEQKAKETFDEGEQDLYQELEKEGYFN